MSVSLSLIAKVHPLLRSEQERIVSANPSYLARWHGVGHLAGDASAGMVQFIWSFLDIQSLFPRGLFNVQYYSAESSANQIYMAYFVRPNEESTMDPATYPLTAWGQVLQGDMTAWGAISRIGTIRPWGDLSFKFGRQGSGVSPSVEIQLNNNTNGETYDASCGGYILDERYL